MEKNRFHEPVMVQEVIEFLGLKDAPLKTHGRRIIDATVGSGGYTLEFVKRGAKVLGIEVDEKMLEVAERRLKEACPTPERSFRGSFKLISGNFKDIKKLAYNEEFREVDGLTFDLGLTSLQLTSKARGFSFSNRKANLDMRLSSERQAIKASDLLNALPERQLIKLFKVTCKRNEAIKLARAVGRRRKEKKIEKVGDFLEVTRSVFRKSGKIHPATRAFLALRIAVNSELENLKKALPDAFGLLRKNGRLIVISFHSGEDAIVKDFFRMIEKKGEGCILTRKPRLPTEKEINRNKRARSAKLRVLEKR